jgi:uncharacterized membrane protein YkvA (DUF1232 family)
MQTQVIQTMIWVASAHEERTGSLAALLAETAGGDADPEAVGHVVDFLREYVQFVPSLLLETAKAADAAGVADTVFPLLEAAESYFFAPDDVIPDRDGLQGLVDDAYLAQSLVQAISDGHRAATGQPLIPVDLGPANAVVRLLVGEARGRELDAILAATLEMPPVKNAMAGLGVLRRTIPIPGLEDGLRKLQTMAAAVTPA